MVMFMYLTPLIIVRKGEMNLVYYYHTEIFFEQQLYYNRSTHFYIMLVIHIGN